MKFFHILVLTTALQNCKPHSPNFLITVTSVLHKYLTENRGLDYIIREKTHMLLKKRTKYFSVLKSVLFGNLCDSLNCWDSVWSEREINNKHGRKKKLWNNELNNLADIHYADSEQYFLICILITHLPIKYHFHHVLQSSACQMTENMNQSTGVTVFFTKRKRSGLPGTVLWLYESNHVRFYESKLTPEIAARITEKDNAVVRQMI